MNNFLYAARPFFDDFLYTIAFMALVAMKVDVFTATLIVGALSVAHVVSLGLRRKEISRMKWMGLGLVLVFGAASLLTRDPRFMLIKPTLIYLAVGLVLAKPGWMARYMPPPAKKHLPRRLIDAAGVVWCGLMFATAALNLVLVIGADPQTWAMVMGIFPTASKLVLFLAQYAVFRHIGGRRRVAVERSPGIAPAEA